MRTRPLLVVLGLLLAVYAGRALAGCAGARPEAEEAAPRALVLVSLDGFRPDYLDRDVDAPTLRWIAGGVRARLVPVFPSKTFPNHYSLVTGLHPEQHGIVGNTMRDPLRLVDGAPARFSLGNREAVRDGRWWGGEPIWVTAERQGLRTAPLFWPGSEAEIGGVRPSVWQPFDGALPYEDRARAALDALDGGAAFATVYIQATDDAGHAHGPDAPEVDAAVEAADRALALLVDGLRRRGRLATTDLVVVSDHGMAPVSRERVVLLDDALDVGAHDVDWGEPSGIWPRDGQDAGAIARAVDALDHVSAYVRADVPARLRYRDHPRIPPVVVLPDVGWTLTSRRYLDANPDRPRGGTHGYDNAHPSMHGVFLARGPHIRDAAALDTLRAVDVYHVLAAALGLTAAPNEGDPDAVRRVLR